MNLKISTFALLLLGSLALTTIATQKVHASGYVVAEQCGSGCDLDDQE